MRNHPVTMILVLGVVSTALATSAWAQGNSIRGKVRNQSGQNMPRIIVQIETGNGSPINTTVTNNEGDFQFSGLGETSYILVVEAPDHLRASEHVDFVRNVGPDAPGENRTVEVILTPKTAAAVVPSNRTISGQNVPKAARDALDRALKLSKENKSQEAVAAMQEAITAYPQYFDGDADRVLLSDAELDEAIAEFDQARKTNPKDDRVYQGFGQVLLMQKKYALAVQVFGEAARLNPTDPGILLMRAGALIEHATAINPLASKEASVERESAFGMAEKDLAKAFDLSGKKLAAVHLQAARLYEKKGDRARAADELEQYLKLAPDDKKADAYRAAIKTLRSPASEKKPRQP